MKPKTVKSFLLQLKVLSEDTLLSELKGNSKLTEDEQGYLRSIIAGIQNDLGEMPFEIWIKNNIEPYKAGVK